MKKINFTEVFIGAIGLIICLAIGKICTPTAPVNHSHIVDTTVVVERLPVVDSLEVDADY